MKALIIEEQNKAVIKEVPVRELEPDEILCRVTYCGICGTDLAIYTGETNFVRDGLIKYPVRIGHEWTGVVDRIGSAVTKFKPGRPALFPTTESPAANAPPAGAATLRTARTSRASEQ